MDPLNPEDPAGIGPFRLLGRLGVGGMGRVFLARSSGGRTVAVKVVHAELAAQEEFRRRFAREVAALERVGGTGTTPVLASDTTAESPWVAVGYVPGPSLRAVVAEEFGPLPAATVRTLAAGLARGLTHVHDAGLVHRDLKPSNVLLTVDGPQIIDFGIARAVETVTDGGLTSTGAVVGSPGFMSPEQVRGEKLTPASDVFCLGSVLVYAATGALPVRYGGQRRPRHDVPHRPRRARPDRPPGRTGRPGPLLPRQGPGRATLGRRAGGDGRRRRPVAAGGGARPPRTARRPGPGGGGRHRGRRHGGQHIRSRPIRRPHLGRRPGDDRGRDDRGRARRPDARSRPEDARAAAARPPDRRGHGPRRRRGGDGDLRRLAGPGHRWGRAEEPHRRAVR